MSAIVDFFTTEGETYEIERYDTDTWVSIATEEPDTGFPYLDTSGSTRKYYRVRVDTGGSYSPWTPKFLGLAVSPQTCTLSGYIYTADGEPVEDAPVKFIPKSDQLIDGVHPSLYNYVEATTDSDGYWEQEMIREIEVYVKIMTQNINTKITVPDSASASLDSLI